MPAYGTAAYTALQGAQNSGTSGAGSYNPTTGALSVGGQNISYGTSTPIYTPPAAGGTTSTTPVVNSNNAQADYMAKMNSYNALSQQIAQQGAAKASQALLDQQTAAQQQLQASETNLKQQGIDIQKTQAEAQRQEAQAKADAAKAIGSPTDTTTPTATPTGTQPTGATPTGVTPTGAQPTGQPAPANDQQTALNTEQAQQQQIQQQKDSVAGQSISLLQSLIQGTIPLTGPQQSLITSLQSQLKQNEDMQTQANNAYTGSVTQAAFRGGGEYTPAQMAGTIQNAVSVGVARIQQLDNSAAKTIAELEQSFQKDNYDIINKQYDILTKQLDDKAKAIKDTYDETTKLIQDERDYQQKVEKDARDFAYQQQQDEFNNNLNSNKFTWQQKQDMIDNALKSGQLSIDEARLALDKAKLLADPNNPETKKQEANNSLMSMKSLVDTILASPYLNNVVGIKSPGAITVPFSGGKTLGDFYGSSTVEVKNQIKQLTASLSLDNRQKLKGSGAISDFEAKTLEQAASAFSTGLSNEAARRQLSQIRGALSTAAGLEASVMVKNPADGQYQIIKATREGINKAIADGLLVEYQ